MDKITHEMRLMQWAPIVSECRNSGMTIKAWCFQNNISEKQFHYWKRRVRAEVYNALENVVSKSQPSFVQLPVPVNPAINKVAFAADIVIHIGNNVIELSNTVSEELLSKVIKVMTDAK